MAYLCWLYVRSSVVYVLGALATVLLFVPCLVLVALFSQERLYRSRLLFRLQHMLFQVFIWLSGARVRVVGLEHIPSGMPVIFASNHQSSFDIPLLGMIMGTRSYVWLVYHIFFTRPVLGYFLKKTAISVEPEHTLRAARACVKAFALIKKYKVNVAIFPEGGRYNTGTVHTFFSGFALLAKKLDMPVVPVYMNSPGKVYPPHSFLLYPQDVTITIGPLFTVTDQETEKEFAQRVRNWFVLHGSTTHRPEAEG